MKQVDIVKALECELPGVAFLLDEPLCEHTFIKTGGNADIFIQPVSIDDLQLVTKFAHKHKIPITILGYGTNVIIKDEGLRGFTLSLENLNHTTVNETIIKAECGASLIEVSRLALKYELTGLEFACGIPGSIGGALFMNAGAYGGEIAHVLKSAKAMTLDGDIFTLNKEDFHFGYRKSIFIEKKYIVLEAEFELKKGNKDEIMAVMEDLTFKRESKQPLEYPSCGSVFKRPPNNFAGKLIQDSGLQGTRIGGAEVSTKHAGFIVNVDNATSSDYLQLIAFVQKTVKDKFDIDLETEVKILG